MYEKFPYKPLNNTILPERKVIMGNDIEVSELLLFAAFSTVSNNSIQRYCYFDNRQNFIREISDNVVSMWNFRTIN
jgi:hypothetical protein